MRARRPGFTLFQLLLLIALLAIVAAILLPAVAQARLKAIREQSRNNLKQLVLAVHTYNDTYNAMPAGVDGRGYSAVAHLLPYIEQANVWKMIDFKRPPTDNANAQARAVQLKACLNPLDPVKSVTMDSGPTNYLFCAGDKPGLKNNNGVFYAESRWNLFQITTADGTANTMMIAETLKGDAGVKAMTVARQHVAYKADALAQLKPEAGVEDWKNDKNIAADRCAAWMDGAFLQGTFTATRAVNDERPDVNCGGKGGLSGLRTNGDSVWIAMADGSTRPLTPKVPLKVIQLLANVNDGQVLPDF